MSQLFGLFEFALLGFETSYVPSFHHTQRTFEFALLGFETFRKQKG